MSRTWRPLGQPSSTSRLSAASPATSETSSFACGAGDRLPQATPRGPASEERLPSASTGWSPPLHRRSTARWRPRDVARWRCGGLLGEVAPRLGGQRCRGRFPPLTPPACAVPPRLWVSSAFPLFPKLSEFTRVPTPVCPALAHQIPHRDGSGRASAPPNPSERRALRLELAMLAGLVGEQVESVPEGKPGGVWGLRLRGLGEVHLFHVSQDPTLSSEVAFQTSEAPVIDLCRFLHIVDGGGGGGGGTCLSLSLFGAHSCVDSLCVWGRFGSGPTHNNGSTASRTGSCPCLCLWSSLWSSPSCLLSFPKGSFTC